MHAAVRPNDTELVCKAALLHTVPECPFQTILVFGMDKRQDRVRLAVKRTRRHSVKRLQLRGPADSACLQVALPNAHLAEGEGQPETLIKVPCPLSGGGNVPENHKQTSTRRVYVGLQPSIDAGTVFFAVPPLRALGGDAMQLGVKSIPEGIREDVPG